MIPASLSRTRLAAYLGLALALVLTGAWTLRLRRIHHRARVLLVGGVEGLDPALGRGLARLAQDRMEVQAGATVLAVEEVPEAELLAKLDPEDLLFRLKGVREEQRLGLELDWITAEGRLRGEPWRRLALEPGAPAEVLDQLAARWPLPLIYPGGAELVPRDPDRFWSLVSLMAIDDDAQALKFMEASRALVTAEPRCAAAWTSLGESLYRSFWVTPGATGDLPQNEALAAFDRALALVPGYPRAALLRAMMETDIGNQREALRGLAAARGIRPWVPEIYSGLAYAGRTSGLLDGAQRALRVRDALMKPVRLPANWFAENTYLYVGQWEAFDQDLEANLRDRRDPVFLFYKGYLALLHQDSGAARPWMAQGAMLEGGAQPFQDLCAVYAAALDGRKEEALERLKRFEAARGSLRVPDGELTFKVAEAYAFLGRRDQAMESAGRAFAQGFGCTRWYEESPLFAPAREHPRWSSLHQHLQERQALLEKSFGRETFGP